METTKERNGADEPVLETVLLAHPAGGRVEIYLQGAQIGTWTRPDGAEVLFVSRHRRLEQGYPVRGGIPVVFPQFARLGLFPPHGFVNSLLWALVERGTDDGGAVTALFRRGDDAATRALWPHRFVVELHVALDDALTTTLRVHNPDERAYSFRACFHTYLRVGDVREVRVAGLEGASYLLGPNDPLERGVEVDAPLRFGAGHNRVYVGAPAKVRVEVPALQREIVVEMHGFPDVVVWSPVPEWAQAAEDFGVEEIDEMLCVEPAAIVPPVVLEPGAEWSATQRLRVIDRIGS